MPNYPLDSPPTLTSLPIELLTKIALQLDLPTAQSLSLVSRASVPAVEHRIFRDLNLYLHPHYGEYVLVQAQAKADNGEYWDWARSVARPAEMRRRAAFKEKVKRVLVETGARRLGMVRRMVVVPRPGALEGIALLLDVTSPNLRELDIQSEPHHSNMYCTWRPRDKDTLDVRLIGCGLSFPSLTHLRLGKYATRHGEFLLLLCSASPNLVHVEADLRHDLNYPEPYTDSEPAYPKFKKKTKIRYLRLIFDDGLYFSSDDESDDESIGYCRMERRLNHPALQLLAKSPNIVQLSVDYTDDTEPVKRALARAICGIPALQDLYWPVRMRELARLLRAESIVFPALRRLVLQSSYAGDLFTSMPIMPSLHGVYLEQTGVPNMNTGALVPPMTAHPEPSPALTLSPEVARFLHGSPQLSVFHTLQEAEQDIFAQLDRIDQAAAYNGTIRSFRHGTAELVHMRRLTHHVELSDRPEPPRDTEMAPRLFIKYTASDGSIREKRMEFQAQAAWQDSTDFKGMTVPLEIIAEMRRVQRASLADWTGRGIEVGDKAWKVLTDWAKRETRNLRVIAAEQE